MNERSRRILGALAGGAPYAVLDGARDRRIRGFMLDSHAPAWCLYRGKLPSALEDAAPWLLRLSPGQPYTEEFFARGWNDCWGIVLTSAIPSRLLRRHLRRFLLARAEGTGTLVFRYYDPRVLRAYLPTCNAGELETFFGPISSFATPSPNHDGLFVFRQEKGALDWRRSFATELHPCPTAGSTTSSTRP